MINSELSSCRRHCDLGPPCAHWVKAAPQPPPPLLPNSSGILRPAPPPPCATTCVNPKGPYGLSFASCLLRTPRRSQRAALFPAGAVTPRPLSTGHFRKCEIHTARNPGGIQHSEPTTRVLTSPGGMPSIEGWPFAATDIGRPPLLSKPSSTCGQNHLGAAPGCADATFIPRLTPRTSPSSRDHSCRARSRCW